MVLHWRHSEWATADLTPTPLPSTLRVLDLGVFRGETIRADSIPASVRWLRLPERFRQREAELQLSTETLVEWKSLWNCMRRWSPRKKERRKAERLNQPTMGPRLHPSSFPSLGAPSVPRRGHPSLTRYSQLSALVGSRHAAQLM